jgi:hypothetical protein
MIRLDTTSRTLQLYLGGAHATAPLQIVVSYSDQTSSTYLGGTQLSNSNGTSTVTICSAPSASTIRDIDMVSVLNTDTATQTVTIQVVDSSTAYQVISVQLLVGEKLTYTHGSAWQVVSNLGNIKYTVLATTGVNSFSGGSTGLTPASATTGAVTLGGTLAVANGGTGTASPSLVAGTNVTISGTWPNQTVNSSTSGTVTSVTGTSPIVSSGGTTPAISIPAASSTVNGYLSSADWTTFNSKGSGTVTSVTGTAPVVSSGGATPAISMAAATTSVSGYLTSTDWNTFNNKGSGTVTSVSGTTGNITSTGGATPVINLASGIATAGTTGSATLVPVVTIDTYGRVTSITTAANPQGTVTSVTGTSPIASSGGATPALSLSASYGDTQNPYASKTANYVLAAPSGTAGAPTFRAIVAADIPTLNQNTSGSAGSVANALTSGTGISFSSGTTYNGSAAITINNSLPMVYPGSGIPNSTGTAWGTSYSTTGSGTVVALATSPSFTTPILGTPQSGNFSTGTFTWPTFNQNTSGTASNVTGTVAIANGGTGQTSASAAFNALSPVTSIGDLIIGNGTNSATRLGIGANTYVLTSNGTTASWAAGGGGSVTISNDTSTASNLYPAFFSATSGTASTVYTSNANLLYKPSTGELTALAQVSSNGIQVNSNTVSANYTIATGNNGLSAGPISVASGISVTISTGSVWTVV